MDEPLLGRIEAYYRAITERDPDTVIAFFSPEAVAHNPVGAPVQEGLDAIRAWFDGIVTIFRSLEVTVDAVFAAGSGAAAKWSARGADHEGGQVAFEGIDVFEFDAEGRIQVLMTYWDPGAMIAELKG